MACFVVPAAEAIVTTIAAKVMKSKENEAKSAEVKLDETGSGTVEKISFSRKLKWLNSMLWGGSALLMFEHLWHGEIVPWFPFFTAAGDSAGAAEMLTEMATAGVTMSLLVTAVWLCMVAMTSSMEKKALRQQAEKE